MEVLVGECKKGFAKKLASPKKKSREKAISLLLLWLTSQKQIEEDELKKIWKGLFYCVWHSDKAPVQADLIERLASIFEKLDPALSLHFFKVFLMTMRREWAGIDRLRLDKFYLLLRKCLVHMLMVLEGSRWNSDLIKNFTGILVENAFLAKDQYAALGINLHFADIFVSELKQFLPFGADALKLLLDPFLAVCAHSSDKSLCQRIKENIFDYLFDVGRTVISSKLEEKPLDSSVEWLGCMVLSLPLGSEAFRLAAMPSTSQANRKLLYELHRDYETLEKLSTSSSVTLAMVGNVEKKKRKALGRGDPDKLRKREQKKRKTMEVSGKKAMGVLDGDLKVKPSKKPFGISEIAGNVKVTSHKRKVSLCDMDRALEGKQELKTNDKRKKTKQKSAVKATTGLTDGHNNIVEESRLGLHNAFDGLGMTDSVVSKLESQFDLLADEESSMCISPVASPSRSKKRKKTKSSISRRRGLEGPVGDKEKVVLTDNIGQGKGVHASPIADNGEINSNSPQTGSMCGNSSSKVKRVRFALRKNLVWTPSTPLPAENVRVPPAATPRGSALKKGVPPGPILSSSAAKALKQRKGTPLRPTTHSKGRKEILKGLKLLAKQGRSV